MKIHVIKYLLFSFLINHSIIFYAQKQMEKDTLVKINLKQSDTYNKGHGEKWEKVTNILRAKYNENYFTREFTNPNSIALSYLKEKHLQIGINENLDEIRIKKTSSSFDCKHIYFEQHINNIPVYSSTSIVSLNKENTVTYFLNNFRDFKKDDNIIQQQKITDLEAIELAKSYLNLKGRIIGNPGAELVYFESKDRGLELAWKVNITITDPRGSWLVIVNAVDSRVIHVQNTENYTNGTGKVYNPNPTTTAETTYGGYYVDNNDANNYYLEQELQSKTLRDLTYQNGKYNLKGPYCWIYDCEPPYTNIPKLSSPYGFNYTRDQEEFEAVNVYYHVDLAGRRVHSLLGYYPSGLNYLIADPHGGEVGEVDNSGYVPGSNYLWFGDGGVDGAEDAEIIWHEYGHAIQEHVGDGNMSYSGETQAVQEGSSDYWAVSYSRDISDYNWALFADWDMHNEFFTEIKKRRLDRDWVYPDDYLFDPNPYFSVGHRNSQIWSSALMEIWEDIDKDPTDRIFLEMHQNWGSHPSLREAAAVFMSAARDLYGDLYLCDIVHRFKDHGLTDLNYTNINLSNPITSDLDISGCVINLTNVTVQNNAKLTIVALKQVNITGSFVASIGSELDISGY